MILVRPDGLSLEEWSDRMIGILQQLGFTTRMTSNDWRGWGLSLLRSQISNKGQIPNPYAFKTWDEWAVRLIGVLSL